MIRRAPLLLSLAFVALSSTAHADSGRLNISADVGIGGAVAGASATPGNGVRAHSLGAIVGLSLDWQFRPPFALEGQFQFGGFNSPFPGSDLTGVFFGSFSFGARFRFLDDASGYPGERGGNLKGHFWAASHLGFYGYDGGQYGFDFSAGYAMSIHRPLLLSPFVRMNLMIGGNSSGADAILVGGIQSTFEVMRSSAHGDQDHDGLPDEEETQLRTDPRHRDTDRDGIPDGIEVDTHTDPRAGDTDADGLLDGFEDGNANGRLDLEESDPREVDTDGGGVSDGDEHFTYHTDPRDRRDDDEDGDHVPTYADTCPGTAAGAIVDATGCARSAAPPSEIATIEFAVGRTRLSAAGESALTALAATLGGRSSRAEISLFVHGTGDAAADAQLAQRRADAIATWLSQHGVERTRYVLSAAGADTDAERTPAATTATLVITRR